MKSHLEFILTTRAKRRLNLLNGLLKQEFIVQIEAIISGRLTQKQFNTYLQKIPGAKGFRRLQVVGEKSTQWLIVFVDDSNPFVTVIVGTHILKKKKGALPDEEIRRAVSVRQEYEQQ